MKVDAKIRFNFDVSQNEFKLLIKSLRAYGGKGELLAAELEEARQQHFDEMARRFIVASSSSSGASDVTRKGEDNDQQD